MTDLATIDLRQTNEPVRAYAWKNLWFWKDGFSHTGHKIHPTIEDAKMGVLRSLNRLTDIERAQISHAIQVPWRGA